MLVIHCYDKLICASSGWYTMPDNQVDFPYGIKESPVEDNDLGALFNSNLTVLIGEADNNPNDGGLRNTTVDVQGTNRLARAQYFLNESNTMATNPNLRFLSLTYFFGNL